jgi:phage terminase Nu1 subunit (DNA packaging protein)
MPSKAAKGRTVNKSQLADLLETTLPTVDNWLRKGCPYIAKPENGGRWQLNVAQVVNWLVTRAEGRYDSADLTAERTRLTRAQADKAERELQIMEGTLLQADEVSLQWSWILSNARSAFLSIPTRCAPQLAGMNAIEAEGLLRDRVYEALRHLAELPIVDLDWQPDEGEGGEVLQ